MATTPGLVAPGDIIRAADIDLALRNGCIPVGHASRPTDTHEGMLIYEVDTGYMLRWSIRFADASRWTYCGWDNLDPFGSPAVGTVPDDILATPPLVYERRADPDVANDSGGVGFPWPNTFPNCIFSYNVSLVVADPSQVGGFIRSLDDNVDLGQWSGQAYGLAPADLVFAIGYVPNGTPVEITYRVVGC